MSWSDTGEQVGAVSITSWWRSAAGVIFLPARNAESGSPTPPGESAEPDSNKKPRNTKNTGPEPFILFYKQSVGDIEHNIHIFLPKKWVTSSMKLIFYDFGIFFIIIIHFHMRSLKWKLFLDTEMNVDVVAFDLCSNITIGGEFRCLHHGGWVSVSPKPGHWYEENWTLWIQPLHRWPDRARSGALSARRHQGALFTDAVTLAHSKCSALNNTRVLRRSVTSSPSGSRRLRSSREASLKTPGLSASPTRTGTWKWGRWNAFSIHWNIYAV